MGSPDSGSLGASAKRSFPRGGYVYIAAVAIAGLAALAHAARSLVLSPPEWGWLALAALTWVSGTFAVKIPSTSATISVSEVFVFSLAILFGGPAATVTVALDGLLTSVYRGNREPRRVLFNVVEPAVSMSVASYVYYTVGTVAPLSQVPAPLTSLVWPVFMFTGSYLLMNTWLTACVIACESGASAASIWRRHIVWLSVNFLAGASIAMLLSVNMRQVSFQGLLLILPLVFLLYLVFRTWTDRVREADSHVAAINRLYLSTVEALAVAIESKDQVTHNHVRRVQTLSMIIAGQLGINDESELRAIEAGALLHDTGKVAVPDYLLNKPGKLTPDEYELIKLHAPIGAEILKAVDFPYAVVPIVRHHHENWDGTGYPDGIKGEAIPIGARIISVVDCFDALTSDRPYRRALSDEDAIAIIQERRGTMYAPPVVDALASCYQEIRPTLRAFEQEAPSDASLLMARFHQRPVSPADSARTGDQTQRTNASDASRSSGSQPGENPTSSSALDAIGAVLQVGVWTDEERASIAVPAVVAVLRTVTPATTVCVSRVNTRKQSVEIVHVAGHGEQLLRGGSIRLGEGITGWVAAHGIGVINSDPALDFPLQFATLTPRLSATLALPIGDARVLTLYTDRPAGFEPAHRAAAERIAERLGSLLVSTANSDSLDDLHQRTLQQRRDQGVGLAALLVASIRADQSCAVLSVASSADRSGVRADVMALVALVLPTVRLSDGVIASAHDEVVAVLPGCEPEAEGLVLSRLQSALDAWHEDLGELMVGFAVASQHEGPGFAVGLQIARDRRRPLRRSVEQPVCEAMALANGRRS